MSSSLSATLALILKDDVSKPARSAAQALADTEARFKQLAQGLNSGVAPTDRFIASLAKLKASKADIEAVNNAWRDYAKSANLAADASKWTEQQTADVRAWERSTVSALRAVERERQNEYNSQKKVIAQTEQLMRTQREQADQQRRHWYGGDKSMAATLGAAALGGAAMAGAKEAFGLGATVQERIAQLKAAGSTDDEIARARADYREFAKTHAGVLESDYLATFKDARVIAPAESFEMAQLGARYRASLRNSGLSTSEEDVGNVLRIMDELGLKDMGAREGFLDKFLKSQQAFGDQIKTETALAAYRNAKQSIYDWSPEFRDKYFPTLLQSSGQQGGTEMMTALNNYIGQHMQLSELKALIAAGFVDKKDLTFDHNKPGLKPGAQLFEADVFRSNIAQWAWDFHDAFMKRNGSTETKFSELIDKMPRNMAALIAFLVHNEPRVKRDAETLDKPIGLEAGNNEAMARNPVAALSALKESLEQFAAAVSSPAMAKAAEMMTAVAQKIQDAATAYSEWAKANPGLAGKAGAAAVGLGVAGGGALTYGALSGLMGGFGLSASATALDGSAAALTAAAGKLGAAGVAGEAGAMLGGGKAAKGMGWLEWLSLLGGAAGAAWQVSQQPQVGSKAWADSANDLNHFFDKLAKDWLPKGWSKPAEDAQPFEIRREARRDDGHGEGRARTPSLNPLELNRYELDDMRVGQDREANRARALSGLQGGGEAAPAPAPRDDGHGEGLRREAPVGAVESQPTARPDVDMSRLDAIKPKTDEAKAWLDALGAPVALKLDDSAFDRALAKAAKLRAEMLSLGSDGGGLPRLSSVTRGGFSTQGVNGQ